MYSVCSAVVFKVLFLFVLFLTQPQPLAFLEEDIREVLKQETGADIFNRADIQQDYRIWKHNVCVVSPLSDKTNSYFNAQIII